MLDGAKALAVPVKFGQSLTVESAENPNLHWKSLDEKGNCWFEATFAPEDFSCLTSTDQAVATRLTQLFCEAKKYYKNDMWCVDSKQFSVPFCNGLLPLNGNFEILVECHWV